MIDAVAAPDSFQLDAAFRLAKVPGLGAVSIAKLSKQYSSAADFLDAGQAAWQNSEVPARLWGALETARNETAQLELAALNRAGAWALSVFDADYPVALREIYDPPHILFGLGNPRLLSGDCVAVVGARRASRYGFEHGYRIARRLAELGFVVVSGMAVGVDATAHQAALDVENGLTAAVLGSGVRNIYPVNHGGLASQIAARGTLVSELHPFAAADKVNFPRRNRIISGLCRGIVIVEARNDSGSLITAREALDQGREVFVVPGPAGGANRGGHRLLADGARWVEDGDDVACELRKTQRPVPPAEKPAEPPPIPPEWEPIWLAMGSGATHVDGIIEKSGLRSSEVLGILLQMELKGWIEQRRNKIFCRTA